MSNKSAIGEQAQERGFPVGKLKEWIEKGHLRYDENGRLILGVPVVIIPREDLAEIQKAAEEILGENGAAVIMYRAGFKHGYRHAGIYKNNFGLEQFDILDKHLSVTAATGWWGKHEIVEKSLDPLKVVIRFYNSIAEEWKGSDRSVCHIWRGVIAGILTFIAESMGKQVKIRCYESKCVAKGDPYCEIVAEELFEVKK